MIAFEDLEIDIIIYIIDDNPISILELKVLSFGYSEDNIRRLRVANKDLSFEVDFDKVYGNIFDNEEEALAYAAKYIFLETNKFINELTDGFISDYFDLDKMIEKYKKIYPELFI